MRDEAETSPDEEVVVSEDAADGKPEDQNDEAQQGEDQDGADGQQDAEDEEVEIVLTGDAGSQPENEHRGIRKRINRLRKEKAEVEAVNSEADSKIKALEDRIAIMQLALEQQNAVAKGPPDPDDYDEGQSDPKYIAALRDYVKEDVIKEVKQSLPKEPSQPNKQPARDLEEKQVKHYQRADQLKVKDYDATEDKAIDILGRDVVNQLIQSSNQSPKVLYYLGKNPGKAEAIKELIDSNPVEGVLEIGRLEARLVAQPKARPKPAPDPDTELEGGSSPRTDNYEKQLEKLREKARSGRHEDMQELLAFKRKHKETQ